MDGNSRFNTKVKICSQKCSFLKGEYDGIFYFKFFSYIFLHYSVKLGHEGHFEILRKFVKIQ
jgi:hypothetical protein